MRLFFYDTTVTKFHIYSYFEIMIDLARHTERSLK